MPVERKLAIRDIYESLPDSDNKAGDIWNGLPTLGLLNQQTAKGIVITPACDLSNKKSETATYLPIIPVTNWLLSRANRSDQLRAIRGQLQAANLSEEKWLDPIFANEIDGDDCQALVAKIDNVIGGGLSGKRLDALNRAKAGVRIVLKQFSATELDVTMDELSQLLGDSKTTETLGAVVRNAYRPDVHFLPQDPQLGDLSSMPQNCLALFRYPLTLPVEVLRAASDIGRPDWVTEVKRMAPQFPSALLATIRPIKISRLRPRFFADLVARFIALHVRMGTQDFTSETVDSLVASMRGKS